MVGAQGHGRLMERRLRERNPPNGSFTVEAAAALRALAGGTDDPILLGYYPRFVTNPYQSLLYTAVREHGIAPVALPDIERLVELEALQGSGVTTLLHLHWLHLVLRDADSERDANRLADRFLGRLDRYLAGGGKLAWTVHNILPHDAEYEAVETRLNAAVAARSTVIHVLAAGTRQHVAPLYDLPADRILHVPHPSYAGAYQDHVSRLDARHELGLMPDELVLAVVGVIRPYKGLDELLEAWAQVDLDGPRRLLIAGAPSEQPGVDALIERAALDPRVVIDARKIPADEMQLFLRAADVAVLPYRRSLNSGALMLALTFGLPVIVPAGGGLAEAVEPSFSRTFDAADPASLVRTLQQATELATPEASRRATAAAAALDPAELSHRFATGLRAMLEPAQAQAQADPELVASGVGAR
jgi:glycosyltransferase involved in cell wall biosynthesis